MMLVTVGATNVTTYFHLRLAATGADATGLTITNFDLQYVRSGAAPAAKVDATALAATDSAHGDNQAFEIDATDQPGVYRVDWPDAAFAAGVDEVILTVKVATAFTESLRVRLMSATRGLAGTALPAAAADAAGGLPISDAGGLDLDAKIGALTYGTANRVNAQVFGMEANVLTATAINADAFTAAKFAADVTTELQSGLATAAELAKVPKSDGTASWNATALAALQSEANDALVAYDPPTKAELDAAVANVSVDEIQASALADLFNTDSGTTYASAVAGSVVAEIADNAGGSALTEAGIADAVWDELIAGHAGVGSTGEALSDAGGAGTPPTVAEIRAEMDANSTKLADILTDTGTTLQAELDAIQAAVITNAAGADIAADIIALKAETASILEDTGTTLQAELDAIQAAVITNAAGTDIAADIIAIKAQTAAIETDTAEIGAAGAGLTNINLPNQTMDIVGNITGNLSGSVGSVTGAVGSVTAEVNANVQKINDVTLTGDGSGTPWGPV